MYQHEMHAAGLHPSQLYESAGGLLIVLLLLFLGRKKIFSGFLFFSVGILYSILRFAVDFTRYYGPGERLGSLSHNQIVCIILFIIFGGLILRGFMFKAESPAGTEADRNNPKLNAHG
jgi:prolipoprotein diacylglyceryltransferase